MSATRPKYPPHTDLRGALNAAVDAYFEDNSLDPHGGATLWIKSVIFLIWAAASYIFLLVGAGSWWEVVLGSISLGLAVAGIGFNVQHDGGHLSFSRRSAWNRLAAWTLDLVGGSSYIWNQKHNILHHHFTNVDGVDDDLQAEPFMRLAPGQKRHWYHRFQHIYNWPLYALLLPKWHWYDDFRALSGKIGGQSIPRPRGRALLGLLAGKIVFATWAFALPLLLHPVLNVLLVYALTSLVVGLTISTVFQLAHCVEETQITPTPGEAERMPRSWAEQQLASTADFAPRNPLLTGYLGGLNFQVEHHLFPHVSHVHYPALCPIVRDVCAEHGVPHLLNPSLFGALRSHVRFLRALGRP